VRRGFKLNKSCSFVSGLFSTHAGKNQLLTFFEQIILFKLDGVLNPVTKTGLHKKTVFTLAIADLMRRFTGWLLVVWAVLIFSAVDALPL